MADFNIQRGTGTWASGTSTLDITVTAVNTAHSYVKLNNSMKTGDGGITGDTRSYGLTIAFLDSTTIQLTRDAGNTGSTDYSWEIVSYIGPVGVGAPNEFIVRDQGVWATQDNISEIPYPVGLSSNKFAAIMTGQQTNNTSSYLARLNAVFEPTATGVQITKYSSGDEPHSYAIVDFIGSNYTIGYFTTPVGFVAGDTTYTIYADPLLTTTLDILDESKAYIEYSSKGHYKPASTNPIPRLTSTTTIATVHVGLTQAGNMKTFGFIIKNEEFVVNHYSLHSGGSTTNAITAVSDMALTSVTGGATWVGDPDDYTTFSRYNAQNITLTSLTNVDILNSAMSTADKSNVYTDFSVIEYPSGTTSESIPLTTEALTLTANDVVVSEVAVESIALTTEALALTANDVVVSEVTTETIPLTTEALALTANDVVVSEVASGGASPDFNIQHITATMPNGTTTYDVTIPAVVMGNAYVRMTETFNGGQPTTNSSSDDSAVACYLLNSTTIRFTRFNTAINDNLMKADVIEYVGSVGGPNEFKVLKQEAVPHESSTSIYVPFTGASDINKCVPVVTGHTNSYASNYRYQHQCMASIRTPQNDIWLYRRNASLAGSETSYALVEYTGSNWSIGYAMRVTKAVEGAPEYHQFYSDVAQTTTTSVVSWDTSYIESSTVGTSIFGPQLMVRVGKGNTLSTIESYNKTATGSFVSAYIISNPDLVVEHITNVTTAQYHTQAITPVSDLSSAALFMSQSTETSNTVSWGRNYYFDDTSNVGIDNLHSDHAKDYNLQVIQYPIIVPTVTENIPLTTESLSLTTNDVVVSEVAVESIAISTESLSLTTNDVVVSEVESISLSTESITLTANPIVVSEAESIPLSTESITLTANPIVVSEVESIALSTESLALTANPVVISEIESIPFTTASLSITANPITYSEAIEILLSTVDISVTPNDVTVSEIVYEEINLTALALSIDAIDLAVSETITLGSTNLAITGTTLQAVNLINMHRSTWTETAPWKLTRNATGKQWVYVVR